jgi:RNA polymerase sigma factor (sigma-70 family)
MNTPDVRLDVKVRNNLILKRMQAAGYRSVNQMAIAMRSQGYMVAQSPLSKLVAMRSPPNRRDGRWTDLATLLSFFLGCDPEELFSEKQRTNTLLKNTATAEITFAAFEQIASSPSPESLLMKEQAVKALMNQLNILSPRQERILRLRYGIDSEDGPKTCEQIAEIMNIGRARVNQIEQTSLRRLRHTKERTAILRSSLSEIAAE